MYLISFLTYSTSLTNTGGMEAPQIESFTVVSSLARVSAYGGLSKNVWLQHSRWVVRTKNANLRRSGSKRSGLYPPRNWVISHAEFQMRWNSFAAKRRLL